MAQANAARHRAPEGSVSRLCLRAAVWSPANHELFPAPARQRALELLRVGLLLSKESRYEHCAQAITDVWLGSVMPHAVDRESEPLAR